MEDIKVENFNKLSLNNLHSLAYILGGTNGLNSIETILKNKNEDVEDVDDVNHGNRRIGQIIKILNILDEPIIHSLLHGNMHFATKTSANGKNELMLIPKEMVDSKGCFLPYLLKSDEYGAPDPFEAITDCQSLLKQDVPFSPYGNEQTIRQLEDLNFDIRGLDANKISEILVGLRRDIQNDKEYKNLLNGPGTTVIIPRMQINDLGITVDSLLTTLRNKYCHDISKDDFKIQKSFNGKLSLRPGKHKHKHETLLKTLGSGPIVGLYFSRPYLGFAPNAENNHSAKLSERYISGGIIEGLMARIQNTQHLFRPVLNTTPGCNFSSLQYSESPNSALSLIYNGEKKFMCATYSGINKGYHERSGGLLYYTVLQ